jgi:hypothetical protein
MPNVTSIDSYAFKNCSSLASIIMPLAISINYEAFYNCSFLASITIPFNVIYPIYVAFYLQFTGCSSLSTLHLIWPPSVTGDQSRSLAELLKNIPSTNQITHVDVRTLNDANEIVDMPSGFEYKLTIDGREYSEKLGWIWGGM